MSITSTLSVTGGHPSPASMDCEHYAYRVTQLRQHGDRKPGRYDRASRARAAMPTATRSTPRTRGQQAQKQVSASLNPGPIEEVLIISIVEPEP